MEPFGKCDVFEGGRAAIEAFHEAHNKGEPYQLLLLDISMPEVDGTLVLYEVRRIEKEWRISEDNPSHDLQEPLRKAQIFSDSIEPHAKVLYPDTAASFPHVSGGNPAQMLPVWLDSRQKPAGMTPWGNRSVNWTYPKLET